MALALGVRLSSRQAVVTIVPMTMAVPAAAVSAAVSLMRIVMRLQVRLSSLRPPME